MLKVEDLIGFQVKEDRNNKDFNKESSNIISIILKAIPLAMSVAVIVLSILKELDISSGFIMLGIGVFFLSLDRLRNN